MKVSCNACRKPIKASQFAIHAGLVSLSMYLIIDDTLNNIFFFQIMSLVFQLNWGLFGHSFVTLAILLISSTFYLIDAVEI